MLHDNRLIIISHTNRIVQVSAFGRLDRRSCFYYNPPATFILLLTTLHRRRTLRLSQNVLVYLLEQIILD